MEIYIFKQWTEEEGEDRMNYLDLELPSQSFKYQCACFQSRSYFSINATQSLSKSRYGANTEYITNCYVYTGAVQLLNHFQKHSVMSGRKKINICSCSGHGKVESCRKRCCPFSCVQLIMTATREFHKCLQYSNSGNIKINLRKTKPPETSNEI